MIQLKMTIFRIIAQAESGEIIRMLAVMIFKEDECNHKLTGTIGTIKYETILGERIVVPLTNVIRISRSCNKNSVNNSINSNNSAVIMSRRSRMNKQGTTAKVNQIVGDY